MSRSYKKPGVGLAKCRGQFVVYYESQKFRLDNIDFFYEHYSDIWFRHFMMIDAYSFYWSLDFRPDYDIKTTEPVSRSKIERWHRKKSNKRRRRINKVLIDKGREPIYFKNTKRRVF